MSLPLIPTVRVAAPDVADYGYMLINAVDFDPATQRLHESETDLDAIARQEKYLAEKTEEFRRSDRGRVDQLLSLAAPDVIRAVEESPASEAVLAVLELAEAAERSGKDRVTVIRAIEKRSAEIRSSLEQSRRLIAEAEAESARRTEAERLEQLEQDRLEQERQAAEAERARREQEAQNGEGNPEGPEA